jgi:hypothetical protein
LNTSTAGTKNNINIESLNLNESQSGNNNMIQGILKQASRDPSLTNRNEQENQLESNQSKLPVINSLIIQWQQQHQAQPDLAQQSPSSSTTAAFSSPCSSANQSLSPSCNQLSQANSQHKSRSTVIKSNVSSVNSNQTNRSSNETKSDFSSDIGNTNSSSRLSSTVLPSSASFVPIKTKSTSTKANFTINKKFSDTKKSPFYNNNSSKYFTNIFFYSYIKSLTK